MKKPMLVFWLIVSQLFFVASLAVCIIMWGFSGEMASKFFYLIVGYLICMIVGAIKSWVECRKENYRGALVWNVLPYAWFGVLLLTF